MWKLTEDRRLVLSFPDRLKVRLEADTNRGETLPDFPKPGDEVELPGGIKKLVVAWRFDQERYPYTYSSTTGRQFLTLELVSPETFEQDQQERHPPIFDPECI